MFKPYNPNPLYSRVGDCTVRALSAALGLTWQQAYAALALEGYMSGDMPSSNHVWGNVLKNRGFKRFTIPDTCPDCYTVADFAADHPRGLYVLATSGHVVCVRDGDWLDSWDSGAEVPIYYWQRLEA